MSDQYVFEVDYEEDIYEETYSNEDILREKVIQSLRNNGMVKMPSGKWCKRPPEAHPK